jgi:hypothetical protein
MEFISFRLEQFGASVVDAARAIDLDKTYAKV